MYHGHPGEAGGAPLPSYKQHSTPKSKGGPVKRSVVVSYKETVAIVLGVELSLIKGKGKRFSS